MPSDIGVKMSVSGVSQFKSAMNDAKGSVKALDAELKLNAAQYKASGDAETYYANRAKILADQIKAQEEVVSNAEKALETMTSQGVKKADKAYTQMQATLAQAKTRLVEMQHRESRRNSIKTTWLPRHRKMKPCPATAPQEKSHVRNWRSKGYQSRRRCSTNISA